MQKKEIIFKYKSIAIIKAQDIEILWINAIRKPLLLYNQMALMESEDIIYFKKRQLGKLSRNVSIIGNELKVERDIPRIHKADSDQYLIPIVDEAQLWLTPTFGHFLRVIQPLADSIARSNIKKKRLLDIYSSLMPENPNHAKINLKILMSINIDPDCLYRDNELRNFAASMQRNGKSELIVSYKESNIITWNLQNTKRPREVLREFSADFLNRKEYEAAEETPSDKNNKILVLVRDKQRVRRWMNPRDLVDINPSLFEYIVPEDWDASSLAVELDRYNPIVICAPGSAAYIPLCLCKRKKIILMPVAGKLSNSRDDIYKDFSVYKNLLLINDGNNEKWDWNKEFTCSSSLILSIIKEEIRKGRKTGRMI